jgi:hypothetical protein
VKPTIKFRLLTITASLSGLSSAFAIILYAWKVLPFMESNVIVTVPGLVLLVSIGVYAHASLPPIYDRLVHGLQAGLVATVGYDLARLVVMVVGFEYTGFQIILTFGRLLTESAGDTFLTTTVGIGYHFLNGGSFGVVYAIIAARARWFWAIGWALVLEAGMIFIYPKAFSVNIIASSVLLSTSIIGHITYGIILGILLRRLAQVNR